MVTVVFRLFIIQTTVRHSDSRVTDETVKFLTYPVYRYKGWPLYQLYLISIRLENKSNKYSKYLASEDQFNLIAKEDWTEKSEISSWKDCENEASTNGYRMFMWENDMCRVTMKLFKRLSKPCDGGKFTLVYMMEPSESLCDSKFVYLSDRETELRVICNGSASMAIRCINGKIYGIDFDNQAVYYDDGNGCITFKSNGGNDNHDLQSTVCGEDQTCSPNTESDRDEYIKILTELATTAYLNFDLEVTTVSLKYDSGTTSWKWASDVIQPTDEGWTNGYPLNTETFLFGYITSDGLVNLPPAGFVYSVCCYQAN